MEQSIFFAFVAGVALGAAYGWISLQAHIKQWKRYADELESENAYLAQQLELETRIYNRLKTDLTNKFSRHETDFSQPETDESNHEHQPPYSGLNVIENPNNPNHFIFTRDRQHENATF